MCQACIDLLCNAICIVAFIIIGLIIFNLILELIKNEVTFKQCTRIINAIHEYHIKMIDDRRFEKIEVHYSDMEPYDSILKRWWDWGYTRILPPDKFEIIKPYVK